MKNVTYNKQSRSMELMRFSYLSITVFCFFAINLLPLSAIAAPGDINTREEAVDAIDNGAATAPNPQAYLENLLSENPNLPRLAPDRIQTLLNDPSFGLDLDNITGSMDADGAATLIENLNDVGLSGNAAEGLESLMGNAAKFEQVSDMLGSGFMQNLGAANLREMAELADSLGVTMPTSVTDAIDSLSGLSNLLGNLGITLPGGMSGGGMSGMGSSDPVGVGAGGSTVAATGAAPPANPMASTCDADIMQSIETRAWMEAQREVVQNANLIAKPDSVLEYSCFNQFLGVLGAQADDMFSDNLSVWGGTVDVANGINGMDDALENLVATPVGKYIQNNFSHSYIGNRGPTSGSGTGANPTASNVSSYSCTEMNDVWKFAKCANFAVRPEDGFLTFDQIANNDPRNLPSACGAVDPRWATYPELSFGDTRPWHASYETVSNDTFNSVASRMVPLGEPVEGAANTCGEPVYTGVEYYQNVAERSDGVCTVPGCYYQPIDEDSGDCLEIN